MLIPIKTLSNGFSMPVFGIGTWHIGAIGWEMEPEDIERLRREFPNQVTVSDAVPLV